MTYRRRLTGAQVAAARRRHFHRGETPRELAREYGVRLQTMHNLLRGETYRTAGGPTHVVLEVMGETDEQRIARARKRLDPGPQYDEEAL